MTDRAMDADRLPGGPLARPGGPRHAKLSKGAGVSTYRRAVQKERETTNMGKKGKQAVKTGSSGKNGPGKARRSAIREIEKKRYM
mmetsp:Transcript_12673/g.36220  ORF Transcript_12673/g.36220 Transcript_12673/m.36220 type:complete len:85 (-) Transcript_12673:773-1027(-)